MSGWPAESFDMHHHFPGYYFIPLSVAAAAATWVVCDEQEVADESGGSQVEA